MRVGIIGAGQSGLMLAHKLLAHGARVDLFTNQTPEEMREGPGVPSQLTLPSTLTAERSARLDFWSGEVERNNKAPQFRSVHLAARTGDGHELGFVGDLGGEGIAVDPRIKRADWLDAFEDRGGDVHRCGLTVSDLDGFARLRRYDLMVIAVGSDDLSGLFAPDPSRRTSHARKRTITQCFLHDVAPAEADVDVLSTPHGEVFLVPTLTPEGPAHTVLMIGTPGGVFDCKPNATKRTVDLRSEMLARLSHHAPAIYERCRTATMLDPSSAIHTRITPAVRHPVGTLPCGRPVLGMGDTLLTVDPASGQGWAASTIAAAVYAEAILAHATTNGAFDEAFMTRAFNTYWQVHGRGLSAFIDMVTSFHSGELDPTILEMFARAGEDPVLANQWIASLDRPTTFTDWLLTTT